MSEIIIGSRFRRWVIAGVREKRNGYFVIPAVCDCGTERLVNVNNLKRGLTPYKWNVERALSEAAK